MDVKSEMIPVAAPANKVFEKLSNLDNLKPLLEKVPREQIPEDKRAMFDNLEITSDSLSIPGGPMGNIKLRVTDRMPNSLIQLTGEDSPVPMFLRLEIEDRGEQNCEVRVVISLEVPVMLKPMIQGPLKRIVDQFAQVLAAINFN